MNRMKILFTAAMLYSIQPGSGKAHAGGSTGETRDYVVLLHGLGRTSFSMKRLEWALQRANYRVVNLAYPSTRLSIEDIANRWLDERLRERIPEPNARINWVTHSLGGIVVRQYLSNHPLERLGRVVMLAPPNQGSELADRLKNKWLYRLLTGPSGQELGTDAAGVPKRLGPARFELGVIAGDRSLNPLFSSWIPGASDGKVSVRSARLDGMRDFLVVHHSHTWIAWNRQVTTAVVRFLQTGNFRPGSDQGWQDFNATNGPAPRPRARDGGRG